MAEEKKQQSEGIEELKKTLAECQKQAEEYLNNWKRAKADYINREKEIEKEREEWIKFANAGLILELLPIYDSLKHALAAAQQTEQTKEWLEGVRQIKEQFQAFLKNQGVEEIKTTGEKLNLQFHEVVEKRKVDGQKSDTIVGEAQAGYLMHGKVLKLAKVIVAE